MTRSIRHPYRLAMLAGYVALFSRVVHADPLGAGASPSDPSVSELITYGPVICGMYLAYALANALVARYAASSWLAHGKRLAYCTAGLGIIGAALQSEIAGSPPTVILVAAVAAAFKLMTPTVTPAPSPAGPSLASRIASTSVILLVLTMPLACGPKSGSLLHAAIDCTETEARSEAVKVLTPVVTSLVVSATSPDGKSIDTGSLKSALSGANAMTEAGILLSCAAKQAFAILLAPSKVERGAPAAAGLELDPAAVRRADAEVMSAIAPGVAFTVEAVR
jgi:hypothetical protein